MKDKLAKANHQKSQRRPIERAPTNLHLGILQEQCCPEYKKRRGSHFEERFRPDFYDTMRKDAERDQGKDAAAEDFHRDGESAEELEGTSETSASQTVPLKRFSNRRLGVRSSLTTRKCVSGLVVTSTSAGVHGFVPVRFSVRTFKATVCFGSYIEKRIPLSVVTPSVCR